MWMGVKEMMSLGSNAKTARGFSHDNGPLDPLVPDWYFLQCVHVFGTQQVEACLLIVSLACTTLH